MGFWPFSKKAATLEESGMLSGFIDWHSHILPGVDDGFKTFDDSLAALREMERHGVRKVWLTPHVMEDYPNETSDLRSRFEELKLSYDGPIELKLASENMLDNLFEERLRNNDFLPIGDNGRHLLVETSYFSAPMNMDALLQEIMKLGYYPVLAHPERYRYMDNARYKELHDMGVIFQSNYISIVGGYGETARKKLEWLLQQKYVSLLGSDLHKLSALTHFLPLRPRKAEFMDLMAAVAANPQLD